VTLQPEQPTANKVLVVDDDYAMREMLTATLARRGFEAVAAANVAEALRFMTVETFDALITDLHMPNPGDGFSVVTAMRHTQPHALTLLVSGYPDVQSAMEAIALQADEIIVKPFEVDRLAELLREKMLNRKPAVSIEKERVGAILARCITTIVEDWLARVKQSIIITHVPLCDQERAGHLPQLVADLIVRLAKPNATTKDGDAVFSVAAVAHGKLRFLRGYTPAMMVHESRILQVVLFGTLRSNFNALDFSLLLPDVMTIADEVDAQLTQSMEAYTKAAQRAA
jgi:ActR/RegA family two-component response regulator